MINAHVEQLTPAPWDNELARDARVQDLREAIVREHLHSVGNELRDDPDAIAVFRKMNIIAPATGQELPRNVGLLFFSSEPERWFPGARIVVTKFPVDRTGTEPDEHTYCGSVTTQLHECLRHLEGLPLTHIKKDIDQIQASGWVSYPIQALQEALINAVFHRSYCPEILEPTKVCIYSDRIEIISYPGPVPGVEEEHLIANAAIPSNSAPARNPRVGEFLTQLRFARGTRTGLPRIYKSMAENGSPVPNFDFDCNRQWFRATLVSGREPSVFRCSAGFRASATALPGSGGVHFELERGRLRFRRPVFQRWRRLSGVPEQAPPPAAPRPAGISGRAPLRRRVCAVPAAAARGRAGSARAGGCWRRGWRGRWPARTGPGRAAAPGRGRGAPGR